MWFALEKAALRSYMLGFKAVTALLPFRWPQVVEGSGSALRLLDLIQQHGHQRILLVTDATLMQLGVLDPLLAKLDAMQLNYQLYDQILPDPTAAQIDAGYQLQQQHRSQAILAVGGGSVIDAAKMIGAQARNHKPITKLTGLFRVWHGMLPLYAIPTTAGTGSEVTIAAVVSDPIKQRKLPLVDLRLMPTAAALDARLMTGMPPMVTASTGMDALTHAIEAYLSRNALARTDTLALEAAQLIVTHLDTAVTQGNNLNARQHMAKAAQLAGMAFTQAGVGYIHAIAHNFGARYHVPHGLANAMLMPYVLRYSLPACTARMATLARHCAIAADTSSDLAAAEALIERIHQMNQRFDIPDKLTALKQADIPAIAKAARAEARFTYAVPRYLSQTEAEQLITQLLPN